VNHRSGKFLFCCFLSAAEFSWLHVGCYFFLVINWRENRVNALRIVVGIVSYEWENI